MMDILSDENSHVVFSSRQAKESPEPVFDLSDCDLKQIPNVCTTIKVLRKECLCLRVRTDFIHRDVH